MSVQPQRVTVTTSATRLDVTTDQQLRSSVAVRNRGAATVYIGGDAVTTADGFGLDPGDTVTIELTSGDDGLYGIVAAGTVACHVLQVGR